MPDYPLQLNLQQRLCVVIGAGRVGLRKVEGLLAAGARVRLVATVLPELLSPALELVARPYRNGDLAGALLAFAATDDPQVNAAVVAEARAARILVNRADDPAEGDFALPAVLRRGALTLTVATGGGSPALAALLREELAGQFGEEWAEVLELLGALRRKRLTVPPKGEYNREILRRLLRGGLPGLLAANDAAGADRLLGEIVGESLETLGIRLPKGKP
ncbi:bifunctional precorrin-2 dehydrogenase/sirohydrochlorin ferrochelatase [Desulfuromonas carbonis]|uniref:precorrin-2 dehydrogenase/sirohydrochlorin ferrochelatase family protein n=1 Tax=Desulfuromonas sp. DDH964 TaxID=1823759 RepID=UPI00078C30B4|nr:bifunctional precorrin-2 dehydrogenase/sirohydrochlorin ferrochelatase [Desulfuromonas sp. DDH964]AMV73789.1 precorrin-2 dehydrogenase and sirohydrochlorin ferrochelatase [Desulfuromonas sp. DDH964]